MRGLGHVESIAYERRHAVVIETASSVYHVSVSSGEFEKGLVYLQDTRSIAFSPLRARVYDWRRRKKEGRNKKNAFSP